MPMPHILCRVLLLFPLPHPQATTQPPDPSIFGPLINFVAVNIEPRWHPWPWPTPEWAWDGPTRLTPANVHPQDLHAAMVATRTQRLARSVLEAGTAARVAALRLGTAARGRRSMLEVTGDANSTSGGWHMPL